MQRMNDQPLLRYADKLKSFPPSYYTYEDMQVAWNSPERYAVSRRLGRGKYSDVFEGVDMHKGKKVVIKVLKPVRKKKIKREIKILQNLSHGPNIIQLLDTVKDPEGRTMSFIFEHVNNADFRTLFLEFSDIQIRHYIFEILRALDYSHSMGIMHRDVKPQNIMLDLNTNTLRLIDWGLAEFYHPGTEYNIRVASRYFKAPELLVNQGNYDYRLDMWSLGCILAGILFRKDTFFRGKDNIDQLVQIVRVLGTTEFTIYLRRYGLVLDKEIEKRIEPWSKKHWKAFFPSPPHTSCCTPEAVDFLDHLLRYDMAERMQPQEAMEHPYLLPVRH